MLNLKAGEKGIITSVRLNYEAQKKLLTYGIGKGALIDILYSPGFSGLCKITINGKTISLRKSDASKIDAVKYNQK
ncbi:MAG: ferrous iron transport protein A [Saprospiraceae bacterium]|nr:ferrous iron transport protein A [Bacteroidia bacterium]NNE16425.1 ferrous iron transport protein A [Saprospiraceae bacterium]NNL92617.1 ferrous iron transport protein A [Saprospiraceae bacterium]